MFRNFGPAEIIVVLVVLILLFGAKRLPDAARSLGRSMRIFKSEVKEMKHDDDPPATSAPASRPGAAARGRGPRRRRAPRRRDPRDGPGAHRPRPLTGADHPGCRDVPGRTTRAAT
jgi:sec-independent protein translocase protein TatA